MIDTKRKDERGHQIDNQEPGGALRLGHERLHRGKPPSGTRPPAQGTDRPARVGGRGLAEGGRDRSRPGFRPGQCRHQGAAQLLREQRGAGPVLPRHPADHQRRPAGCRRHGGRLCLHRTPVAGAERGHRSRRQGAARHRGHPAGAGQRPARDPRRPQGQQPRPRKHLPGPGKVRHRHDGHRPLGQTGPRHRARRRDPPRRPGALAPHQEQPGAHRRARRRQDRSGRGPGPAHGGRRCPRVPARQDADRPGPGSHDRRGQVPRRVRGTAQGGPGGNQGLRRADRHVHRRDPHRCWRRCLRGCHGRGQHAQAHAGPRRAAPDRRHHA